MDMLKRTLERQKFVNYMMYSMRVALVLMAIYLYFKVHIGEVFSFTQLFSYIILFSLIFILTLYVSSKLKTQIVLLIESSLLVTLSLLNFSNPLLVTAYIPFIFLCGAESSLVYGMITSFTTLTLPIVIDVISSEFGIVHMTANWLFNSLHNFTLNPLFGFIFVLGVVMRIYEEERRTRQRQNLELERANAELMNYALEIEKIATIKEQNRIALEIHDTIGYALTSVIRGTDACLELVENDPKRLLKHLKMMREVAQESLKIVRKSIHSLKKDELLSSSDTFKNVVEKFVIHVRKMTDVNIFIEGDVDVSKDKYFVVYQCVKEAVTNALRHANAKNIAIRFKNTEKPIVEIENDGLLPKKLKADLGMNGIKRRTESVGGKVEFIKNEKTFIVRLILG